MAVQDVEAVIQRVGALVVRSSDVFAGSGKEYRTRYYVIDPVVRSLGWDTENPNECEIELGTGKGEADYVLLARRNCKRDRVVLIEAKSLDADLLRHEDQLKDYVDALNRRKTKPQVAVLTNGRDWWIYDLDSQARFFRKRHRDFKGGSKYAGEVDITKNKSHAALLLHEWLSKERW